MPGGITLLQSAPSDIPTPGANKDTLFIDNTASPNPAPAYKDSAGVTRPLIGATGAQGPAGNYISLIEDGLQGEDGIPGAPGLAGTAAPTNVVLFAKKQLTELQLESMNTTPITVVAAPGSGLTLNVISFSLEIIVTTGYSSTPGFQIVFNTNTTQLLSSTPVPGWNIIGTYYKTSPATPASFTYGTFDPRNKSLDVRLDANPGSPGTGVATATVHVAYFISTTP